MLAIGLVVDDAIVVLENIFRHMEMGKTAMQAALDGAAGDRLRRPRDHDRAGRGVRAGRVPHRQVGRLFNEFGIVGRGGGADLGLRRADADADALLAHAAAAARRRARAGRRAPSTRSSRGSTGLTRATAATRRCAPRWRRRWSSAVPARRARHSALFLLLPARAGADRGPRHGLRHRDRARGLDARVHRPLHAPGRGASSSALPERSGLFTAIGLSASAARDASPTASSSCNLKPRGERDALAAGDRRRSSSRSCSSIPGVLAFVINPPSLGGSSRQRRCEYVLQAETLRGAAARRSASMMGEAQKLGYLVNLDTDLRSTSRSSTSQIDRDRAAGLGVSVTDIGTTLETLLGGRVVTRLQARRRSSTTSSPQMQAARARATPRRDRRASTCAARGGLVQLANVVTVQETVAPQGAEPLQPRALGDASPPTWRPA